MLSSLVAISLTFGTLQAPPNQGATVKVGKQDVVVAFPASTPPNNKASVTWNGISFFAESPGIIGRPHSSDGSWQEILQKHNGLQSKLQGAAVSRIKVFLFTKNVIIERSEAGIVRYRRSGLEQNHIDDIYQGLAQMKVMAEVATQGEVRFEIDVQTDPDLTIDVIEPSSAASWKEGPETLNLASPAVGSRPFGFDFIRESIGPRINRDAFESDDRTYRGPFASVLAFHGGLIPGTTTVLVDGTPVSVVPFHLFAPQPSKSATGPLAYRLLRHHVSMLATGQTDGLKEPEFSGAAPLITDVWPRDMVEAATKKPLSQSVMRDWTRLPAVPLTGVPPLGDVAIFQAKSGDRPVWVARFGFADKLANSPALGRFGPISDPWIVYVAPEQGSNLYEWLGIAAPSFSAVGDGVYQSTDGSIMMTPGTTGDPTVEVIQDPELGQIIKVTQMGLFYRGEGVLAAGRGQTPAVDATAGKMIDVQVRSSDLDRTAINLYNRAGDLMGSILVHGDAFRPVEIADLGAPVVDARVPFDGAWQRVQVDLEPITKGQPVWDIRIGRPPFGDRYQRPAPARQSVEVAKLRIVPVGEKVARPPVAPTPLDAFLAQTAGATSPLSGDMSKAILAALIVPDADLQANAAELLTKHKLPEAIPTLIDLSRSGSTLIAYSATRALAFQDTPEGWSALESMMVRGPFDFNRRFAATVGKGRTEASYANGLRGMTASSGWRGRLMGIQGQDPAMPQMTMMLVMASLQDEEPAVRLAASRLFNPNFETIARRMVFSAVNDGSQWVRIASYLRLIDSELPQIQSEGLKGVRDEAIGVRLSLLNVMTTNPKPAYRPALNYAVVDTAPEVRAAALDALAAQEGPVAPGEIQNTFADQDYRVQLSLLKLAKTKSVALPRDVLTRLSSSSNAEVARMARELSGS